MKKQKPHMIFMALLLLAFLVPMKNYAQFSTDVGVSGVSPTATVCDAGAVPVSVLLTNLDAANPTNGPVSLSFTVNGGAPVAGPSVTLIAGEAQVVSLGTYDFNPGTNVISVTATYGDDATLTNNNAVSSAIVQFNGTYTVGSAMTFATLKSAIDTINLYGLCGATTLMMSNEVEMLAAPIVLTTATTSAVNTLTIREATPGSPRTLTAFTGVSTTLDGIFTIAGTDYVTLRGLILMENPANITATTQMEWGIGLLKGSATNGTQNVKINGVLVQLNKANTASKGIYSANHTTASTTALTVTNVSGANSNNIIDSSAVTNCYLGIYVQGYNDGTSPYSYLDQGNYIGKTYGNIITNFGGVGTQTYGIYAINQNNLTITKDSINGGTGTTTTTDGIYIGSCNNGNINIVSNVVVLASSATTSQVSGIRSLAGANPNNNNVVIQNNKVKITATSATTGTLYGIQNSSTPDSVFIQNNIVSGIVHSGTGVLYGIDFGGPTAVKVDGNIIEKNKKTASGTFYGIRGATTKATVVNNIVRNDTATAGTSALYGYYNLASPTYEYIANNQIYGFVHQGTGSIYGINTNTTAGAKKHILNNQIYNLTSAGGTGYGISQAAGDTTRISGNKIYGITNGSTSGLVYGIYITSGTTNIITNNFISSLLAPAANAALAVSGIYVSGGTKSNVYHNTVYLDGTSTGTNFGGAALYASTTPTLDMINNVLINNITPVGTGLASAYRRSGTTLTSYSNTSDNNFLYAGTPGASNVIYSDGTNTDQTLASFQARVTPRDAASATGIAPFVNVATTPYDLHLQTTVSTGIESGGKSVTTVLTDIDGDARNASTPDIGADEFAGIPSYTCAAPSPGNTISSVTTICDGQTITLSLQNATAGTGVSYQWQSSSDGVSFSNVGGAVSSTYSVVPTAAIYYQCVVTCANGPATGTSTPINIDFANSITSTTPASRCGTGTVSLAATGSAGTTINWYDALTGGNKVGTGSPWTTPSISSTTTYYAGAETPTTYAAARITPAATSSDYWTNYGLVFNTSKDVVINSVDVYPSNTTPANLTIRLINSSGAQVPGTSDVVFMPISATGSTAQTVALNYNVPAGNNYKLIIATAMASTNKLVQETTGFTYPITVNSVSITSNWNNGSTSTSYYDWFYNWNVTEVCSSQREAVVATIGASPALTLTANQSVCENSIASVSVTSTLSDYDSYVWSPSANLYTDAACTAPYDGVSSATTLYFKSSTAGATTYTCTANNSATLCSNVATTVITQKEAIIAPVATNSSVTVCQGWASAIVEATAEVSVTKLYSFGNNLQSTGTAANFNINIPALPAGATVTNTTLNIYGAKSVNGSYRSEIRVALSGITTLSAYQISTLGSAGSVTPDPVVPVTNIPAAGGALTLTLTETYDDAGVTDATFDSVKLSVTYTTNNTVNWYNANTAGTLLASGNTMETVGTSVMPNTSTPGTYNFYAAASDGSCESSVRTMVSVVVNPVLVALNPVDVSCNGGSDGSFTLGAISCGTAPFTYSVDGGAFGPIPTNLTAGSHDVVVRDNGGNESAIINIVISEPTWTVPNPTAGSNVSICQNATSAIVSATPGSVALPATITVSFDVASQPVETNASPGNIVATATMPALPAGASITSAVLTYNGLTPTGSSWQSDVRLGFSGAVTNAAAAGTGAANATSTFNYTRSITPSSINTAGGSINLLYWDSYNDNSSADECTFPLGLGVATLTITYNPGTSIYWYDAAVGGNLLGSGASFEVVGTSVLPNTSTSGNYSFYAEGAYSGCNSPGRAQVDVVVNPAPVGGTASSTLSSVCVGSSTNLNLNAFVGTIQWQSSADGLTWNDMAGATGSAESTGNLSDTTYFRAVVTNGTCGSDYSNVIIVNTLPLPSITLTSSANPSICDGGSTTIELTFTGTSPFTMVGDDGSGPASFSGLSYNASLPVLPSVTTTYSVISLTDANNCVYNGGPSVTITVFTESVGGDAVATDNDICEGTGTSINLSGNNGTIQWQSSTDNVSFNDISGETNSALSTGNLSSDVYYRAVVSNGVCTEAYSDTVLVNVNALPNVTFTGTLADQCVNNTTYALSVGAPVGGTYSGTGVSGTNFDATVAGIGTQTITYSYTDATTGCSNSATNSINVNALPSVTFTGTLADQCANNTTYALSGGTPVGGTYSGTGVSGTNFDASAASVGTQTITYSYTDGTTGCSNSATNTIDVIALPTTPIVTMDSTGGITILTSDAVSGNQWFNSLGSLSGETNATYTVTENGSYYVQVTANGCTSENSNTIIVDWITGINDSYSIRFELYPNPSSDFVNVLSEVAMTGYSLFDANGKLIESKEIASDKISISVANLNSGIYYVRILTEQGSFIQPIQVQNK